MKQTSKSLRKEVANTSLFYLEAYRFHSKLDNSVNLVVSILRYEETTASR